VIVKPDGGCQGKGIVLTNDPASQGFDSSCSSAVAQAYLDKPFLIDGFKFDMRVYVLVTSIDPLRVYLYDEGIARFCTAPYLK
jgi:tubulin polyglutamylase TTLL6/13